MNKKKKIKLLEISIILVIIISIITILLLFNKISKERTTISDSDKIQNYKLTKYFTHLDSIDKAAVYNIPYFDRIDREYSFLKVTITSIDNYINDYRENIAIYYFDLTDEEKTNITNYCNAYDKIEDIYSVRCSFEDLKLEINNLYHISKITTDSLTINNTKIVLPVKRTDKTNIYLEYLTNNNIEYEQLEQ